MGITGLEQLDSMAPHIPFLPVDVDLADKCYIIILDPAGAKNAHMGILVDLAGMSTNTKIAGVFIHAVANQTDEQIPHSTAFQFHEWTGITSDIIFRYVGKLSHSKYLVNNNHIQLPPYLTPPAIPFGTHQLVANPATPLVMKSAYLYLLGSCMYHHMASQYQPIWSYKMNCQQYSRLFLTDGLGLIWPEDMAVVGDILPVIIDVSILFISSTNKIKTREEARREEARKAEERRKK